MINTRLRGREAVSGGIWQKYECRILTAVDIKCCTERILALLLPSSLPRCPGGGIGRRARLKLAFRKECGFDSHPGYQKASLHAGLFCWGLFTPRTVRLYLACHDTFFQRAAAFNCGTPGLGMHVGSCSNHGGLRRPASRWDHVHVSKRTAGLWAQPRIHGAGMGLGLYGAGAPGFDRASGSGHCRGVVFIAICVQRV